MLNVANLNRMESSRIPSNFDPRPANMRSIDLRAIDILRVDLLNVCHACAFTTILVPSVERALLDHTYSKTLQEDSLPLLIPESASHQLPASPSPLREELQPLQLPTSDLQEHTDFPNLLACHKGSKKPSKLDILKIKDLKTANRDRTKSK